MRIASNTCLRLTSFFTNQKNFYFTFLCLAHEIRDDQVCETVKEDWRILKIACPTDPGLIKNDEKKEDLVIFKKRGARCEGK